MKLKDIQPFVTYAVFNRRTYDSGRTYAEKFFFTPQQLKRGTNHRGALWGLRHSARRVWWDRDVPSVNTWKQDSATLQTVQMPWNEYEAKLEADRVSKQLERQRQIEQNERNKAKREELEAFLELNHDTLEAIGFPVPRYAGAYIKTGGQLQMHFTKEQLEAILERLSAEVTA